MTYCYNMNCNLLRCLCLLPEWFTAVYSIATCWDVSVWCRSGLLQCIQLQLVEMSLSAARVVCCSVFNCNLLRCLFNCNLLRCLCLLPEWFAAVYSIATCWDVSVCCRSGLLQYIQLQLVEMSLSAAGVVCCSVFNCNLLRCLCLLPEWFAAVYSIATWWDVSVCCRSGLLQCIQLQLDEMSLSTAEVVCCSVFNLMEILLTRLAY